MNSTNRNRTKQLIDIITLSLIDGIGVKRIHKLIAGIGSVDKVLGCTVSRLSAVPGISRNLASMIVEKQNRAEAEKIVERIGQLGWNYFLHSDKNYPAAPQQPFQQARFGKSGIVPGESPGIEAVVFKI